MSATYQNAMAILDRLNAEGRGSSRAKEAWLASLSDVDLVEATWDIVSAVEDEDMKDMLYRVVGEAFERFAPEADWANDVRDTAGSGVTDLQREMESTVDAKFRRAELRLRARLTILGETGADDA